MTQGFSGVGLPGPEAERCCLKTPHSLGPGAYRPNFQDSETHREEVEKVPSRGLSKALKSRGWGRGLRSPFPRQAAPRQAALHSRTGGTRPRAGASQGQEGSPGPEAEGTLKMQSSIESPVFPRWRDQQVHA